jgi:hypothetical protein
VGEGREREREGEDEDGCPNPLARAPWEGGEIEGGGGAFL